MPVNRTAYYQQRRESIVQTSRNAQTPKGFNASSTAAVAVTLASYFPDLELTPAVGSDVKQQITQYLQDKSGDTCRQLLADVLTLFVTQVIASPITSGTTSLNASHTEKAAAPISRDSSKTLSQEASWSSRIIRKQSTFMGVSPPLSRKSSNVTPRSDTAESPGMANLDLQGSSHLYAPAIHTRNTSILEDEDDDSILQINDYVIVDEAGRGAYGCVKIAVKEGDDQVYAIKIVPKKQLRTGTLPPSSACADESVDGIEDELVVFQLPQKWTEKGPLGGEQSDPLDSTNADKASPSPNRKRNSSPSVVVRSPTPDAKKVVSFRPAPPPGKPSGPGRLQILVDDDDQELGGPPQISPKQFLEEVEVMKKLHHRNVVRLVEVIDDPSDPNIYLVMPYCDRGPILCVHNGVPTAALDIDIARGYLRQIVAGLSYLHNKHLAHLDIKPDNILLDAKMRCYLSDFGTSKFLVQPHESDRGTGHAALLSGFRGTPAFAAPEVVAAVNYDPFSADIWSLGVTFYAMVFGKLPYAGDMIGTLVNSILTTEPDYTFQAGGSSLAVPRVSSSMTAQPDPVDVSSDDFFDDSIDLEEAVDLMKLLMHRDPTKRPTAVQIRNHPFLQQRRGRRTRVSEIRDQVEKSRQE